MFLVGFFFSAEYIKRQTSSIFHRQGEQVKTTGQELKEDGFRCGMFRRKSPQ
jgi:hypothetical protein